MLCSCLVAEGEHKPNKRVYSLNAVAERDREGGRREGGTGTKAAGERGRRNESHSSVRDLYRGEMHSTEPNRNYGMQITGLKQSLPASMCAQTTWHANTQSGEKRYTEVTQHITSPLCLASHGFTIHFRGSRSAASDGAGAEVADAEAEAKPRRLRPAMRLAPPAGTLAGRPA